MISNETKRVIDIVINMMHVHEQLAVEFIERAQSEKDVETCKIYTKLAMEQNAKLQTCTRILELINHEIKTYGGAN